MLDGVQCPRMPKRIPSVLAVAEVKALLSALPTDMDLLASLLKGTGVRLMNGPRLRVKDVDLDSGVLVVRPTKGDKDRVVMLPRILAAERRRQVRAERTLWKQDRQARRCGRSTCIGDQIPGVGQRWRWFWVFSASSLSVDLRTGMWQRYNLYEERLQRALKKEVAQAGICKLVSVHPLCYSFATPLLQSCTDIRTVQELLGHSAVSTTMIYIHVLKVAAAGATIPLDSLALHLRPG